jgi:hypothetical protein
MNWLRAFFRSRYSLLLEEEYARLRSRVEQLEQENRELVNSALVKAGMPALPHYQPPLKVQPVRKRSWHQIQAVTEERSTRRVWERERRAGDDAETESV